MRVARFVAVLVACASMASAQTFRGGIQGTVTDQTDAALPGVIVTATSVDTGLSRSVETDPSGNYFFSELPLGEYTVSTSLPGFAPQTVKSVEVEASRSRRVDVQLHPGGVQESVEVVAGSPLVDSTRNVQGDTIAGKQAAEIPLNGRDFTKLLSLVPGTAADPSGINDSPGSFGLFSINGNRGRSNNYLLDGTDMNDGYRNLPAINEGGVFGTPATVLPIDAIAEFPILSGAEAEYGRNAGGIINIVTKSGTNRVAATAYEFFRDEALGARNFFNREPAPKNEFRNNQFGGSIGGPIKTDKTFYFVAYEGQREHGGLPGPARVPTDAELQDAIAANGGAVNPVIQGILDRRSLARAQSDARRERQQPERDDAVRQSRGQLHREDRSARRPGRSADRPVLPRRQRSELPARAARRRLPAGLQHGDADERAAALRLVHASALDEDCFSKCAAVTTGSTRRSFQRITTSIRIRSGWRRSRTRRTSACRRSASRASPTSAPTCRCRRGRVDSNYQAFANLSYNAGRHNWKGGYEFRRTTVDGFFDAGYRGRLDFDSLEDFVAGRLAGGRQAKGDSQRFTFQNNHAFYVQDAFQARRNVTLNWGVRWDYYGVIGADGDRFSVFDTAGQQVTPVTQLYEKDWNNFSPRVSAAWDVTGDGKRVVRAGYGLYYDAFSQDFFVGQLPWNTFNPGPAYNDILFSFSPVAEIVDGAPVFDESSFSASDVFTVERSLRTPYVQIYNVNYQHELGARRGVSGRLRRIAGPRSLSLSRHQPARSGHRRRTVPRFHLHQPVRIDCALALQLVAGQPADARVEGADLHRQLHVVEVDGHGERRPGLRPERVAAGRQHQS